MASPPLPKPFVNEDISKPENRTNLALFGLMLIPQVRTWLLERLELPLNCVVYPPVSVGGYRPDLVVVSPKGVIKAWVEIELGGENHGQLTRYRGKFVAPVKSIVGLRSAGGHLSLEEVAHVVSRHFAGSFDPQQKINAEVFATLVAQMAKAGETPTYTVPTEAIQQRPLIAALSQYLSDELRFGIPPIAPGTVLVTTMKQKGWTIRVLSKVASGGSVAILFDTAAGRERIHVPSRAHLSRYLPMATAAIDDFVAFFAGLGLDITAISEAQRLAIDEQRLVPMAGQLAERIQGLAQVFGAVAPSAS